MEITKEYLLRFMDELKFPEEAVSYFCQVYDFLEKDQEQSNEMNLIIIQFFHQEYTQVEEILERLDNLAKRMDIHSYTVHFMFYMYCSKILQENYIKAGISEDIFWNSMLDLRCKLIECYDLYGIWGTFVASWFPKFFEMQRFGLGRLQYEYGAFEPDEYTKKGVTVHKGDRVFNIHIPSSGALTRADRMASYQKAYEFFKDDLNGKPIVFVCNSWLLYPDNEKIMTKSSNIVDFMHDFDIIQSSVNDSFSDAWRVFGKAYNNPVDQLPTDTSMQRGFVDWLKSGNKTGSGFGVILFDGTKIL